MSSYGKMNKKGWIKIVEAFIAILLLIGVSLFLYGGSSDKEKKDSSEIYKIQRTILESIQNNEKIRSEIVSLEENEIPVAWDNFDTMGLTNLKKLIESMAPKNMECVSKVCKMNNEICDIDYIEKDVYTHSTIISVNKTDYNPRQVKLFCYKK